MTDLLADRLRQDPRIAEAKRLVLEAIQEHQSGLTDVCSARDGLKDSYQSLLDQFAALRGGKLWYPYVGSGIGKGPLVELCDGSVKYDFICGIGVHHLGHSHPALVEAGFDACVEDTIMQGHLQQNQPSIKLSKLLVETSGMDHAFLSTSGAISNENAWKIIFQKRAPAHRIIAFEHCFTGRTLAMAQITDKAANRVGLPPTVNVDYIPFYDYLDPEGSTERCLDRLQTLLERYPGEYAGITFEPIQGEGGFYPGTEEFYTRVFGLAKEHGLLIHADEVQTFGRTHSLYAFQHFQLQKLVDVVTIGKLSQICATLYRSELSPKPGLLSQTFTASNATIRGATAMIRHLIDGGCFGPEGKNARIHRYFQEKLEAIGQRNPGMVRGPFGLGGMVVFTPFDGDAKRTMALSHALFEAGVMCFICGSKPMRLRFLLPVPAVEEADIDAVCEIVESVLMQSEKGCLSSSQ